MIIALWIIADITFSALNKEARHVMEHNIYREFSLHILCSISCAVCLSHNVYRFMSENIQYSPSYWTRRICKLRNTISAENFFPADIVFRKLCHLLISRCQTVTGSSLCPKSLPRDILHTNVSLTSANLKRQSCSTCAREMGNIPSTASFPLKISHFKK